jgi:N-acetylmuramoyl-L-alanine amidase
MHINVRGVIRLKLTKSNFLPIAVLILCCLAFLLLSYLSYSAVDKQVSALAGQAPQTVVIDAGHGGEDGGASGQTDVLEKEINLAIAKDLQQFLQTSGMRVVMTRTTDDAISDDLNTVRARKRSDLQNRLKMLQDQGNCIFVSIHQNHFPQKQYHGTQVFYSKNDARSKDLAENVRSRVTELLQTDNQRETKPATSSIYLLWQAKVPAVLVECGFLSNAEEEAKLNTPDYQQKIAFSIGCGVLDFYSGLRN